MTAEVRWPRNDYSRIPLRLHHDEEIYALEMERIFRGPAWSYLCLEAEIPNPDGQLRPGSFANASIVSSDSDRAVIVPTSSLVTFAGVEKVLSVKDGKVIEKRVTIGRRDPERLEIVSGVAPGDMVIVTPGNLVEGAPVKVAGRTRATAE